jgi:SAM-dependent methyltransferase
MKKLKALAKQGRKKFRESRAKILRRLGFLNSDWDQNLPAELQFWDWALKDGARNWDQGEWRNCSDPNLELQPELKALIPAPVGAVVRILDVGSGPLTRVGKRWDGRDIQVVPVDPLANKYNRLLAIHQIKPIVAPVFAHGEKLLDQFAPNSFDLAYASNSLDHSYDPVLVIRQMLGVVKPGHYVYLWHVANEGARECYAGLHQWNFDIRKGEFVVDDGRKSQSVSAAFSGQVELDAEFQTAFNTRIVVAKLKKL